MYMYERNQSELIIECVHNYFYAFFGSSIDYQIDFNCDKLRQSLKNIASSRIGLSENMTGKELEACFTSSPSQKFIAILYKLNGKLCPDSVLYNTENLYLNSTHIDGDDLLSRFRGKSLFLVERNVTDSNIIRFLNEWKSSRKFQNLKFFSVFTHRRNRFDVAKVLYEADIKHLNPSETTLKLEWKQRFVNFNQI
ncbi:hypothetical protein CRE_18226 [Caenorhabditis remanei]|uniref:F-box associated domain-containing protein n=1 Tax=Caenorhabditis remanei TaxID=31234 RepID=E3NCK6_CAERE|nr:hypothetical protein CRE_18226 [Caenorhabditis remanei]